MVHLLLLDLWVPNCRAVQLALLAPLDRMVQESQWIRLLLIVKNEVLYNRQWRNFISGARRQDVVESPPPLLRFNVECFYSIVNHQIQRVRIAVNISSIWCLLPHKSLDPVAYLPRVFGAWGEDGNWRPSLQRVRLASAKALSLAIGGGLGRSPRSQRFWDLGAIGSE